LLYVNHFFTIEFVSTFKQQIMLYST